MVKLNKGKKTKEGITKLQLLFLLIAGMMMLAYTSLGFDSLKPFLGSIGGSIFISTILTKKLTSIIKDRNGHENINESLTGLLVGALLAGLFVIPINSFLYIYNSEITILIFLTLILVGIIIGSIVGFLINYIKSDYIEI